MTKKSWKQQGAELHTARADFVLLKQVKVKKAVTYNVRLGKCAISLKVIMWLCVTGESMATHTSILSCTCHN